MHKISVAWMHKTPMHVVSLCKCTKCQLHKRSTLDKWEHKCQTLLVCDWRSSTVFGQKYCNVSFAICTLVQKEFVIHCYVILKFSTKIVNSFFFSQYNRYPVSRFLMFDSIPCSHLHDQDPLFLDLLSTKLMCFWPPERVKASRPAAVKRALTMNSVKQK